MFALMRDPLDRAARRARPRQVGSGSKVTCSFSSARSQKPRRCSKSLRPGVKRSSPIRCDEQLDGDALLELRQPLSRAAVLAGAEGDVAAGVAAFEVEASGSSNISGSRLAAP